MRTLKTALIADDNRISRMMLREVLERLGSVVFEASNGVEALIIAIREKPDLIISDLLMPKIDGFALAQKIQEENIQPPPKLFMITAVYKTRHWRNEAHSTYHADEFLAKPVEPEALERILRKHFELEGD